MASPLTGVQLSEAGKYPRLSGSTNPNADWMSALCPSLWDVPLQHLSIPGDGCVSPRGVGCREAPEGGDKQEAHVCIRATCMHIRTHVHTYTHAYAHTRTHAHTAHTRPVTHVQTHARTRVSSLLCFTRVRSGRRMVTPGDTSGRHDSAGDWGGCRGQPVPPLPPPWKFRPLTSVFITLGRAVLSVFCPRHLDGPKDGRPRRRTRYVVLGLSDPTEESLTGAHFCCKNTPVAATGQTSQCGWDTR